MKKHVVLSVNENPKYFAYLPLVTWAWRKFGWEPIIFFRGELFNSLAVMIFKTAGINEANGWQLPSLKEYGSDTITQISRLYAACVVTEQAFIMTSDVDMIPLSDYWDFNEEAITIWGHDLTGYQHTPICYIGMKASYWKEVMKLESNDYNALIKRDLDSMPNAKSEDSVKRWVVDQDLITERINASTHPKEIIIRGMYENGYPIGRVDRSAWSQLHNTYIDCHGPHDLLENPDSREKLMRLLRFIWPEENFTWFENYLKELKQWTK